MLKTHIYTLQTVTIYGQPPCHAHPTYRNIVWLIVMTTKAREHLTCLDWSLAKMNTSCGKAQADDNGHLVYPTLEKVTMKVKTIHLYGHTQEASREHACRMLQQAKTLKCYRLTEWWTDRQQRTDPNASASSDEKDADNISFCEQSKMTITKKGITSLT